MLLHTAIISTWLWQVPGALGADAPVSAPAPVETAGSAFARNYVGVELTRNFPFAASRERFAPGEPHPAFFYRHDMTGDSGQWLMGLGAQFKMMQPSAEETELRGASHAALWTLTHETYYVLRLDHPTYLLVGPKLLYLLPARTGVIPLARESAYETEVGGAISLALARAASKTWLMTMRADLWRGTRTTRFMGLEIAFGASRAID
jgi:hypothetical protein